MHISYNPDADNPWGLDDAPPITPLETNIQNARDWCQAVAEDVGLGRLTEAGKGGWCQVLSNIDHSLAFKIRPKKIPANWRKDDLFNTNEDIVPPVFEAFPWWKFPRGIVIPPYAVVRVAPINHQPDTDVYIFISMFSESAFGAELPQDKLDAFHRRINDFNACPKMCDIKKANITLIEDNYVFNDGGALRLEIDYGDIIQIPNIDERFKQKRNLERMALARWLHNVPPITDSQRPVIEAIHRRQACDRLVLQGLKDVLAKHCDDVNVRVDLCPLKFDPD